MKKYQVEFSDVAEEELIESVAWGIEVWGAVESFQWVLNFKAKTQELLSTFPKATSLAPESTFSEAEIRQLIIGRYRVLYEVRENMVYILHIRGAFAE